MKAVFFLTVLSWAGFSQTTSEAVMTDRAAARFLDQATWGPSASSIATLKKLGISKWLEKEFAARPSDLPDQPQLAANGNQNTDLTPVQAAFFRNAVIEPDQLRQRVAFALSEIWVVSQVSVRPAYAFPPYWRVLRDNAFGNYRDIIKAVTLCPAMGAYLSMVNNNKANPAKGTAANENYARELLQLFTVGLTELNPDGSQVLDSNHNPIPTYDQAVVTELAKVFTGWTFATVPGATPKVNNPPNYFGQMFSAASEHDTTAKAIFNNVVIPAGMSGDQDLDLLLAALMAQPSVAPFISQQLIQHMVTSNPSAAYIKRVSAAFSSSNGDMKAVITAILTDPEARAGDDPNAAPNPNFGHLREPVLFLANMARGLNATVGANNTLNTYATELGQNLFNAASVFSYFSPQNRVAGGLLGPEFQIYSTQTASDRADVVNTALYSTLDKFTTLNLGPFTAKAGNVGDLVTYIGAIFLHNGMSASLAQAATAAANAQTTAAAKVQAALYVVLTSSEYQVIQ